MEAQGACVISKEHAADLEPGSSYLLPSLVNVALQIPLSGEESTLEAISENRARTDYTKVIQVSNWEREK